MLDREIEIKDLPRVFEFKSSQDYLKTVFHFLKLKHNLGLKECSRLLGYKSPSLVTMILRGDRFPSREFIDQVSLLFNLKSDEKHYLVLLVKLERAEIKGEDTLGLHLEISKLLPEEGTHYLNADELKLISEWYFLPLKQLVKTESFREDPEWIYRKLRKKLTPSQIKYALEVMIDLGVLERDGKGRLLVSQEPWRTVNNVPSEAIKKIHRRMIELSLDALVEQSLEDRHFLGLTQKISKDDLPEAKKFLNNFIENFNNIFSRSDDFNGEVYQLNIQHFALSDDRKVH